MKKILSLFLLTLLPIVTNAETVEIDGIYYNLVSKVQIAEVTYGPRTMDEDCGAYVSQGTYTGDIVIPEFVSYEGIKYNVTSIYGGEAHYIMMSQWNYVGAFSGCKNLTSITIPSSITAIGRGAFQGCNNLTKVNISNLEAWCKIQFSSLDTNPLYYAKHLYMNGKEIKDLVFPNSLTSIGDYAFSGCSGLTSITIPESVTSIGSSAFSGCSGLTAITIPNSVTNISDSAFYGCSSLTSITLSSGVTCISNHAFNGCSSLTSITIPNSVTSIGNCAFNECSCLTSITIPNSVTSIGSSAFSGCSGLTAITIPYSVTSIGDVAFSGCSGLKKVIVLDIAAWCGITFGSNPLSYAHHLYSDEFTEIKDLIIPNSVTRIGNYAFSGCSGLTSVTIPNSVTSISGSAFKDCTSLSSVTFPNSVTNIGSSAFENCTGMTSATIPESVTSVGDKAFYHCTGLTLASIGSGSIGEKSFEECNDLSSLTIGDGVKSIGQSAFKGCSSLSSITMGTGIKTISGNAFASCPELTDVYCYAENVPSTNSTAFKDSYIEYATLYVPESAIEQYKATAPWSQFGTLKTTNGDTPDPPKPEICATPTISYLNGKLKFNCETEDVSYIYEITDSDIKIGYDKEVDLTVTYNITVYATKDGYKDSEAATATLCWIDVEPQTEGIIDEDAIAEVKAMPVLIQSQGSTITIQGAAEGTPIAVYDIEGKQYGTTIAEKNRTTITTSLRPGSVAVVKIGEKSVKVKL